MRRDFWAYVVGLLAFSSFAGNDKEGRSAIRTTPEPRPPSQVMPCLERVPIKAQKKPEFFYVMPSGKFHQRSLSDTAVDFVRFPLTYAL